MAAIGCRANLRSDSSLSESPFGIIAVTFTVARQRFGDDRLVIGFDQAFAGQTVVIVVVVAVPGGIVGFFFGCKRVGFFLGVAGFFSQQRDLVLTRDLVVIGMDFGKGQEAVAVAAIVDESCLQRRFYPGNLGEIDIALDLLVFSRFKIEFLNPVSLEHRHPGFFLVARIDQHARCHSIFSVRAHRAEPAGSLRFCLLGRCRPAKVGGSANGLLRMDCVC